MCKAHNSPLSQELVYHTQQIMQNALIKRKLEEQKENYRRRQEQFSGGGGNVAREQQQIRDGRRLDDAFAQCSKSDWN